MSLQPTIEPAGALQTGWKLVPKSPAESRKAPRFAKPTPPVPDDDTRADPRSAWEMGEIG